ncbi:hypothetical protein MHUMG1_05136 [Metarhizium humberi]|uniref:Uncharacterized protein n=1 Tax=Metarhizium humberi TaxID=2596975 RepID=A0A9P8MAJ6_9HYPO|nr:hypothetical protein MHUMG1_05136 [Metarhizium humberi]
MPSSLDLPVRHSRAREVHVRLAGDGQMRDVLGPWQAIWYRAVTTNQAVSSLFARSGIHLYLAAFSRGRPKQHASHGAVDAVESIADDQAARPPSVQSLPRRSEIAKSALVGCHLARAARLGRHRTARRHLGHLGPAGDTLDTLANPDRVTQSTRPLDHPRPIHYPLPTPPRRLQPVRHGLLTLDAVVTAPSGASPPRPRRRSHITGARRP